MGWDRKLRRTNLQRRQPGLRLEALEPRQMLAVTAVDDHFETGRNQPLEPGEVHSLIAPGSTWKYYNPCAAGEHGPDETDADFYSTWQQQDLLPLSYDGPAFSTGPAPLGYGFGVVSIATMLQPCFQNVSVMFFTTTFDFQGNPGEVSELLADVITDDGAVFYLNGQEIGRRNMTGVEDVFGVSASFVHNPDETFVRMSLSNALTEGTNQLAVSVHNFNSGDDFGLEMRLRARVRTGSVLANDNSGPAPPLAVARVQGVPLAGGPVTTATPHGSVTMRPDGFFVYTPASGYVGEDTFTYEARNLLGETATATVTIAVRSPDDRFATTQDSPLTLVETVPLVARQATWNYFQPTAGVDPATTDPDYHATWFTQSSQPGSYDGPAFTANGPGSFAYGGISCCTPGTLLTPPLNFQQGNVAYFTRQVSFAGDTTQVTTLYADLLVDDGAFVYLNGREVARVNVPLAESDTFNTPATTNHNEFYNSYNFAGQLTAGTNHLAVSVHQANVSDMGFDMQLDARVVHGTVLANDVHGSHGPAAPLQVARVQNALLSLGALRPSATATTAHGSVTMEGDGAFVYTPQAGFYGLDSFTYVAQADGVNLPVATATIHVRPNFSSLPCSTFDLNTDGVITRADVALQAGHNGTAVPAGTLGDVDFDGVVGLTDLPPLRDRLGESCGAASAPAAVNAAATDAALSEEVVSRRDLRAERVTLSAAVRDRGERVTRGDTADAPRHTAAPDRLAATRRRKTPRPAPGDHPGLHN